MRYVRSNPKNDLNLTTFLEATGDLVVSMVILHSDIRND